MSIDNNHLPYSAFRDPDFSRGNVHIVSAPWFSKDEVAYVIRNMRERDVHEFSSVGVDHFVEIPEIIDAAEKAYMVYIGVKPVFIFGWVKSYEHVRLIFGFGTSETTKVIPVVTEYGRDTLVPMLFEEDGATRLEVRVPESCESSVGWLMRYFGARCECELEGYSITGETYKQLALTPRMFNNVQFQISESTNPNAGTAEN